MEYLATEDLLRLANQLGVGPVRDFGLLDSAAYRPRSSLFGQDAYPDLDVKAASLLESIVRNHPLVDGNKRLGWLATLAFYYINGIRLNAPDDECYDLVIAVASGQRSVTAVAEELARWH